MNVVLCKPEWLGLPMAVIAVVSSLTYVHYKAKGSLYISVALIASLFKQTD